MKWFLLILTATLLVGVVVVPGARPSAAASGEASADTLRHLEAEFILGSVKPRSSGGYKRLGSHVTGESFAAQCTFSRC
jgi:hypothetical protein